MSGDSGLKSTALKNEGSARILVIDDEPQIRKFLTISLRAQGHHVLDADCGSAGLKVLATQTLDLVILDLGLPDLDGKEVLRELRSYSQIPVIVLSVRANEDEKVAAFDAGANDYVTKPFGVAELGARIRALLRMSTGAAAPTVFDDGCLQIDIARRSVSLKGVALNLSRKEWALLALLLKHAGRVVMQQQILKELWGATHVQDTHYLRILVGKLRAHLDDDAANPRYIATESGVGLKFLGANRN